MSTKITVKIDAADILNRRGLGPGGRAWLRAGQLVKEYCADYAPYKTGNLALGSCTVTATGTGAQVHYGAPYAHFQYYGRTMGPNVKTKNGWRSMAPPGGKTYTGGSLKSSGGRGSRWDQRMMNARGSALMAELAAELGGTAK